MSKVTPQPKIGFVSLGCPKNLVDSERILTELRTEGYDVVPSYDDADMVIVNTCGFIDSAVQESLEAIGEALNENGKVIVTGCLGAKEDQIREVHPKVLEITGPHSYEQVLEHVHHYVPKPKHNPFLSLVPEQGVKLTPRHYAYLKISEGCNHRCTFCIIPSMRGDLVSRPIGEVLSEAKRLVDAGVKEILVISQDTSAYGVDVKHRTGFHNGEPVKTSMVSLCEQLSKLGIWTRLHYVYPYPHVDDVIPLMAEGKNPAVSGHSVAARQPAHSQTDEASGFCRSPTRAHQTVARNLPGTDPTLNLYCRLPWRDRRRFPDATRLPERSASGSRWLL